MQTFFFPWGPDQAPTQLQLVSLIALIILCNSCCILCLGFYGGTMNGMVWLWLWKADTTHVVPIKCWGYFGIMLCLTDSQFRSPLFPPKSDTESVQQNFAMEFFSQVPQKGTEQLLLASLLLWTAQSQANQVTLLVQRSKDLLYHLNTIWQQLVSHMTWNMYPLERQQTVLTVEKGLHLTKKSHLKHTSCQVFINHYKHRWHLIRTH